jgi:hypothetical protein
MTGNILQTQRASQHTKAVTTPSGDGWSGL